jgi:hypothetical protein
MAYNIVTNFKIINEFKKRSRYFKINLGIVNTVDKNGNRILNDKDNFANFYNTSYKTTIFGQGNIGDIKFYLDHYIKEDVMAVYYNEEEFIFDFDKKMIEEKGVDFFIGHIIKTIETDYSERLKEAEIKKAEPKPVGDADKLNNNPGQVTYADIKAYLDKQNSMRYAINKENKDGI